MANPRLDRLDAERRDDLSSMGGNGVSVGGFWLKPDWRHGRERLNGDPAWSSSVVTGKLHVMMDRGTLA
jgi:hypothetical protein